ncbi:hypothetical protein ACSDR0_04565 [Streptosporangium sp. G11]|uniref:hypothetical protein n=1 Tax=Streptosporangium sp. G11 TaxID=3436926 RepID=UPI003EC00739
MEPTVPAPARQRCPLGWCDATHPRIDDGTQHTRLVADLDTDRNTVQITYLVVEAAGQLQPPALEVMYGPDWAVPAKLLIPLAAAGALGDVIALLDIRTFPDFGAALTRGSKGPDQGGAVKW